MVLAQSFVIPEGIGSATGKSSTNRSLQDDKSLGEQLVALAVRNPIPKPGPSHYGIL
jgi:hypothetical protein